MSEKRRADMKEHLELSWMGAIENANIRGKFKRAIRVFCDKDVRDVLESLDEAHNMVWLKWTLFAPDWAAAEVDRLYADLADLDEMVRKDAWTNARDEARRQKRHRLRNLADMVVSHIKVSGGQIDYNVGEIAGSITKAIRKRSHVAARVDRVTNAMARAGIVKFIPGSLGKRTRVQLLVPLPNLEALNV